MWKYLRIDTVCDLPAQQLCRKVLTTTEYPELCSDLLYIAQHMQLPDVLKASLRLLDQLCSFQTNLVKRSLEVELVTSPNARFALMSITDCVQDVKHCLSLDSPKKSNALVLLSALCGTEENPQPTNRKLIVSSGSILPVGNLSLSAFCICHNQICTLNFVVAVGTTKVVLTPVYVIL